MEEGEGTCFLTLRSVEVGKGGSESQTGSPLGGILFLSCPVFDPDEFYLLPVFRFHSFLGLAGVSQ